MCGMQANERVQGRAEKISRNSQVVLVNQAPPFEGCRVEEQMATEQKKQMLPESIEIPAPTFWPMVAALGLTLLCAGLVTHAAVSVVGLIVAFRGAIGWFREVLPVEKTELVPITGA